MRKPARERGRNVNVEGFALAHDAGFSIMKKGLSNLKGPSYNISQISFYQAPTRRGFAFFFSNLRNFKRAL